MASYILVIDDDTAICEALADALDEEGYEVLGARSAATALELIEQAQPDLILLDLRMPGMDGPAFIRCYQERPGRRAPIILMSGVQELDQIARELGAAGFLAKPFMLDTLLALVRKHIQLLSSPEDQAVLPVRLGPWRAAQTAFARPLASRAPP